MTASSKSFTNLWLNTEHGHMVDTARPNTTFWLDSDFMESGYYITHGHRCKESRMWRFEMLVFTPADGLCCVWFIYPAFCWFWCPEVRPALSIGPNWVGFLSEDGDRVQSPKRYGNQNRTSRWSGDPPDSYLGGPSLGSELGYPDWGFRSFFSDPPR
jgi:hypothetical protein